MTQFLRKAKMPVSAKSLFDWHARPGAFERLVPPWDDIEVVHSDHSIKDGARLIMRIQKGPAHVTWEALHHDFIDGERFTDTQVRGPFARWVHTHRVETEGDHSVLIDDVDYALPLEPISEVAAGQTKAVLDRMFDFRHRRTFDDLTRHALYKDNEPMKIAITGASGLIGKALTAFLTTGGHDVHPLVRRSAKPGQILWDIRDQTIDAAALEGMDAVIHLAGEPITGRWTDEKKARIRESRVAGTTLLATTLAGLKNPPKVFVSTSAVGFYGDRGAGELDETSGVGTGFLANVCKAWEDAAQPAADAGIRVVHPRIGIVLSPKGGALKELLLPFKLGAGGVVGSGDQYMSWISLDDIVGAFLHVIQNDELSGPVNFTGPKPVPNRAFAKTLGHVLHRPSFIPLPAAAVKLAMGEMGETLLLEGANVVPKKLQISGFKFLHPSLEIALRAELGL